MAIPKINLPLYEAEIPSTGQKIKFRPFTVKEEKILLMAQESKDLEQTILAILQILGNCITDDIDVEKLAVFDIEYLMLMIRAKSVSNEIEFSITDPDTNEEVSLKFNVDVMSVNRNPKHTNKIKISDDTVLTMRYPTFKQLSSLKGLTDTKKESYTSVLIKMMMECIDTLYQGEDRYQFAEFSTKEVEEFFENLPASVVSDMETFFDTMPSLKQEFHYKDSTGKDKTFTVEGTETFFT